ncbi:hypothetical protein CTI12_AA437750 [Artemisia annua]|uniref:Uncharacterized protein n=1 Tax=Artemisia annua TaxID=35608 RepID=A0A2U1LYX8_ARTAN|nr:hypothetical protein CTI12_AA437750 [Artemisia annua]
MSSKPDIIEISSDSTSSDELMSPPPWNLPHNYSNLVNKKTKKKVYDSTSSSDLSSMPSFVSSYHSSSEDDQAQTKSPKKCTSSVSSKGISDRAVSKKGTSFAHVQTHLPSIPGKRLIVLRLANEHIWAGIKGKGKKSMPDTKGKGKRSIG